MKKLISAALLGTALALSTPVLAEQGQAQASQQQAADFTQAELQTFVDIQKDIGKVRKEYVKKIRSAGSKDEAKSLQQEARESLVEVVKDSELSVEKYNAIATAYQSNKDVRKQVNDIARSQQSQS
ncbi:DUF4168 domain-containing protein [Marinobacteraceae bacterium S3BR75-40.1]